MIDGNLSTFNFFEKDRRTLYYKQKLKVLQKGWRLLISFFLTGGLLYSSSLPYWLIRNQSQIRIIGNQLLSESDILKMLDISYPQLIWKLPIHQLRENLKPQPSLENVYIIRSLLPAKIKIIVKERRPVAFALMAEKKGFLDSLGIWISSELYNLEYETISSVKLKVFGQKQRSFISWKNIYPLSLYSPIKIKNFNLQDSNNLILDTELGIVHYGIYDKTFSKKLMALGKMKGLSFKNKTELLDYIEVYSFDSPSIYYKPYISSNQKNLPTTKRYIYY
ncbi:MAG: FtsQ-type POTRA domain-containing protein [Candidatus Atelocyanobacterium thalassa]|uniref:Cell division septal protein n=1 Tax=Candidatus Atelocyanobacterium thalassa isolate SIO64986 TaxID=1527444 RepID=A0A086CIV9_9CHRO|nr:MAG: cell division septal protein [Candidatus Atelocyanobacterium thalassa isolate SIO64986]